MKDIKINEEKYFLFINTVKKYIMETQKLDIDQETKEDGQWIKDFVNKELKIREQMMIRDKMYEFYVKTKETNVKAANEAYNKFCIAKNEIEKLRGKS